jgi:hypothetical protein
MLPQFDNKAMSSVLLWLDNALLTKGAAYTNFGSKFFKVRDVFDNCFTYGLPFKQIIADSSITGATVMSGIYINNVPISKGTSGLIDINYDQGHVYFSGNVDSSVLSGNFAVKDFNIYLTNEPEEKLLFETKFEIRPKTTRELTGLAPNTRTFPAIFLINNGGFNEPFAFGGLDSTHFNVRLVVLADNQFNLDAVCSILRDKCRTNIVMLSPEDLPFNHYGGIKSGQYDYPSITEPKTDSSEWLYISNVNISRFSYQSVVMSEVRDLNPSIFPALIDLELEAVRLPRG